jgi:hypothetical protein
MVFGKEQNMTVNDYFNKARYKEELEIRFNQHSVFLKDRLLELLEDAFVEGFKKSQDEFRVILQSIIRGME